MNGEPNDRNDTFELPPAGGLEPTRVERGEAENLPQMSPLNTSRVTSSESDRAERRLVMGIFLVAIVGVASVGLATCKPGSPSPVKTATHQAPKATTPAAPVVPPGCSAPAVFPPPPAGGMSYVNWYFNKPDIYKLTHSIDIKNDPGPRSDLYLQLYDGSIDNTGQYYGIQTTGLVLFSQFGTTNSADNIKPAPGSTAVSSTSEGPFISLRRNFGSLAAGHYTTTMMRTNFDGVGDWFAYYVTFPGKAETYIGSMRFARATPRTAASFHDGGGSWTEFWDNNGNVLYPVPVWSVAVGILANNTVAATRAVSAYSKMPNSDTEAGTAGQINFVIGGSTPRCHPAGELGLKNK